jgi:hypothetical protein
MVDAVCAVVDGSNIVRNKIVADPAKDAVEGFSLVASDTAAIGDHWDGTTFTRPAPSITIEEAIAARQRAVDALAAAHLAAGMPCTYGGATKVLQVDPAAQGNFTGTQAALSAGVPLPAGFAWRALDNTFFPAFAAPADFTAMAAAVFGFAYACKAAAWAHKDAIAALTTGADVQAHDITTGWP